MSEHNDGFSRRLAHGRIESQGFWSSAVSKIFHLNVVTVAIVVFGRVLKPITPACRFVPDPLG